MSIIKTKFNKITNELKTKEISPEQEVILFRLVPNETLKELYKREKHKKPKNSIDNVCKTVVLYMLSLIWRGGRVGLWHQS